MKMVCMPVGKDIRSFGTWPILWTGIECPVGNHKLQFQFLNTSAPHPIEPKNQTAWDTSGPSVGAWHRRFLFKEELCFIRRRIFFSRRRIFYKKVFRITLIIIIIIDRPSHACVHEVHLTRWYTLLRARHECHASVSPPPHPSCVVRWHSCGSYQISVWQPDQQTVWGFSDWENLSRVHQVYGVGTGRYTLLSFLVIFC